MTREQARTICQAGEETTVATLLSLARKVDRLTARLSTNSRNSSKPPSSDGYQKPVPKSQRTRSGRKPGGQVGHPGSTLQKTGSPDHIVVHCPRTCCRCGHDLSDQEVVRTESRQVFDLPPLDLVVTEHQLQTKRCGYCHTENTGSADHVDAPTQYGPRMEALAVYLKSYQLLPYKRCAEFIQTLFSCSLTAGTLANMVKDISARLDDSLAAISQIIADADVASFDETGDSVKGKRSWVHVACTEAATFSTVHPKRGVEAMEDMCILPRFYGTAIHDGWKPYFTFQTCSHGLGNAHHLRECTFVEEVLGQPWARRFKNLPIEAKEAVDAAKARNRNSLCDKEFKRFLRRYDDIIAEGIRANPAPLPQRDKQGPPKDTKAGNLVRRLKKYRREVLAFLRDFSVPFENNEAERDLRMIKVQLKISGTFRSDDGATDFCRIRSYVATALKRRFNAFDVLVRAARGNPFVPSSA